MSESKNKNLNLNESTDSSTDVNNDEANESQVLEDGESKMLNEDDVDIEPTVDASTGASLNVPEHLAQSQGHETMARITEVVITYIDGMKDGEKTTLKDLQNLVAEKTGLKGSNIGPVISMIVKAHGGVTVELGRYGGIYKGIRTKPEKVADTKPRCPHCKQAIRQKTGPRKKKNKEAVIATAAATTAETSEVSSAKEEDENNLDDEDFKDPDFAGDTDDEEVDSDDENESSED